MNTYQVPARFWADHVERGCRCAEDCPDQEAHQDPTYSDKTTGILNKAGRIQIVLSDLDLAELVSDARHYSDAVQMMGPEYLGLQSSARATVRRLA